MRKKSYLKLTLILLVFTLYFNPLILAQDDFFDGSDWSKFLPLMKISYISGLYDGSAFSEASILNSVYLDDSPMLKHFPTNLSYKEVVNLLDEFYRNRDNFNIPIVYAIHIIKMENTGESVREVNKYKKSLSELIKD